MQSLKSESLEKTRLETCKSAKLKCLPRRGKYIVEILIDVRLAVFPYFQNFDFQVTVLVIEIKVLFLSTTSRFSPLPPKKNQSNKQNYNKTKQQSRSRHIGRKIILVIHHLDVIYNCSYR